MSRLTVDFFGVLHFTSVRSFGLRTILFSEDGMKQQVKRGKLIALICALVALFAILTVVVVFLIKKDDPQTAAEEVVELVPEMPTQEAIFTEQSVLSEGFTDVLVTDEASALKAVESVASTLGIKDVQEELQVSSVANVWEDSFYRMQQYYEGVPVYGRSVVVSADKNGVCTALTSNFKEITASLDLTATVTVEQVNTSLSEYFGDAVFQISELKNEDLVVYVTDEQETVLAYRLEMGEFDEVLVHAQSAKVLNKISFWRTAEPAEVASDDGSVTAIGWRNDDGSYHLHNDEYKIDVFDIENEVVVKDNKCFYFRDEVGLDTMYSPTGKFEKRAVLALRYTMKSAEFFSALGVDFAEFQVGVNETGGYIDNAFGGASSFQRGLLAIGKELEVTSETVGHEYTHAVSAVLIEWAGSEGETGAVNEGYSDIFGELIEEWCYGESDWIYGDRNLVDPGANGTPESYEDENFKDTTAEYDKGYVHHNSTVISHAAYLMYNGIDGDEAMKLSDDQLAELFYRSMHLMNSTSNFEHCANTLALSAAQMTRANQLTPDQYRCVLKALDRADIFDGQEEYTGLRSVCQDAELKIIDRELKPYANYYLEIRAYEWQKDYLNNPFSGTIIREELVEIASGYVLDLSPGFYTITVRDMSEYSSHHEFTVPFRVSAGTPINWTASETLSIYTDFGLLPSMADYCGMTLGQLRLLHGEIIRQDSDAHHISLGENSWSFSFENVPLYFAVFDYLPKEDYDAIWEKYKTDDGKISFEEIQEYNSMYLEDKTIIQRVEGDANIPMVVYDDITTDITYGELREKTSGFLGNCYFPEYGYSECYKDMSHSFLIQINKNLVCEFRFYEFPDESDQAHTVFVYDLSGGTFDNLNFQNWKECPRVNQDTLNTPLIPSTSTEPETAMTMLSYYGKTVGEVKSILSQVAKKETRYEAIPLIRQFVCQPNTLRRRYLYFNVYYASKSSAFQVSDIVQGVTVFPQGDISVDGIRKDTLTYGELMEQTDGVLYQCRVCTQDYAGIWSNWHTRYAYVYEIEDGVVGVYDYSYSVPDDSEIATTVSVYSEEYLYLHYDKMTPIS